MTRNRNHFIFLRLALSLIESELVEEPDKNPVEYAYGAWPCVANGFSCGFYPKQQPAALFHGCFNFRV